MSVLDWYNKKKEKEHEVISQSSKKKFKTSATTTSSNLTFHALWQTLSIIKLTSLTYSSDGHAF